MTTHTCWPRSRLRATDSIERLSITFTANGKPCKMKFPFCQNTEKLDSINLLSYLLTSYIEELLKRVRQDEKRKFSRFCDTQLPTVCRLPPN